MSKLLTGTRCKYSLLQIVHSLHSSFYLRIISISFFFIPGKLRHSQWAKVVVEYFECTTRGVRTSLLISVHIVMFNPHLSVSIVISDFLSVLPIVSTIGWSLLPLDCRHFDTGTTPSSLSKKSSSCVFKTRMIPYCTDNHCSRCEVCLVALLASLTF